MTGPTSNSFAPVAEIGKDRLEAASFAAVIAKYALEVDATNGAVVALHGAWGIGKTSILNFAKEHWQKQHGHHPHSVIDFQPWMFSSRDDVVLRLLEQISSGLKKPEASKGISTEESGALIEIGEKLSDYAKKVGAIASPFIDPTLFSIAAIFLKWRRGRTREPSLSEIKINLQQKLAALSGRIIVIIDDVDRLTPQEIVALLRGIKATADFPNVVYVIALDRDTAAAAVSSYLRLPSGNTFLDKILPTSFHVPSPTKEALRTLFGSLPGITNFLKKLTPKELDAIRDAFFLYVDDFLSTPRDAIMLAEAITVADEQIGKVANPTDILASQTLRLFAPSTFAYLSSLDGNLSLYAANDPEDASKKFPLPSTLAPRSLDACAALVATMLPQLAKMLGKQERHIDAAAARKARRIHSPDYFKMYFDLSPISVPYGREVITSQQLTEAEIDEAISSAKLRKGISGGTEVPRVLRSIIDEIDNLNDSQRLQTILAWLFNFGDHAIVDEDINKGAFGIDDTDFLIKRLASKIWKKLPQNQRLNAIINGWRNPNSLGIPSIIIREFLSSKSDDNTDSEQLADNDGLLSANEVKLLREFTIKRIENAAQTISISSGRHCVHTLFLLKELGALEIAKEIVREAIREDETFLALVGAFISPSFVQRSDEPVARREWKFRASSLQHFVEVDTVRSKLHALLSKPNLPDFVYQGLNQYFSNSDN